MPGAAGHGGDPKWVHSVLATEAEVDAVCEKAKEDIYAKVAKHLERHPNDGLSGKKLVELEDSLKELYKITGRNVAKSFREGLPEVMREAYDKAKEDMKGDYAGKGVIGPVNERLIKTQLNNSFEQIAMRTDKMSFDHIRQLRQISAEVFRTATLTGASRAEVTKQLMAKAMEIPGFKYTAKDGRVWSNQAYFKMLARTELMNAGRLAYDQKCAEEGYDVVELTYSGHSCPECTKWEGQIFSLTGATPGIPTKDQLIEEGVFHPNCTHTYTALSDYELKKRGLLKPEDEREKEKQEGKEPEKEEQKPIEPVEPIKPEVKPDTEKVEQKHIEPKHVEKEEPKHVEPSEPEPKSVETAEEQARMVRVNSLLEELERTSNEEDERERLEGCANERAEAEELDKKTDSEIYDIQKEDEAKNKERFERWEQERELKDQERSEAIQKNTEKLEGIRQELSSIRKELDEQGLSPERKSLLDKQKTGLEALERKYDRMIKLGNWDRETVHDVQTKNNVRYIYSILVGKYPDLNQHQSEEIAKRLLDLNAQIVSANLRDTFRPGMEKLGPLPRVVLEETIKNKTKGAHFNVDKNELHLDALKGDCNSTRETCRHEFGHWLDWHTRLGGDAPFLHKAELSEKYDKAWKADKKKLVWIPKDEGKDLDKLYGYSNDYDHRGGTFWADLPEKLFGIKAEGETLRVGGTWEKMTFEQRHIIISYTDTMQSMSAGKLGWGHPDGYARKEKKLHQEAMAEAFAAYSRNDTHYAVVYPNLWGYIKNLVDIIEKEQ